MIRALLHPLDRKLVRELWRLRGQALAIALVIGAGVAVVVTMFGMLASLEATRDAYYERYRFADIWAPVKRAPAHLEADLSRIEGVASVETRIFVDVTLDVPGMAEPATGRMVSIPRAGRPVINDVVLRQGRWPSPDHTSEVLANETFMQAHGMEPGDEVAAIVNGRKRTLTIAGVVLSPEFVYAIGPGELMPDNRRFGVLWMGREALAAAFDLDGAFNEALIRLMPHASKADVIDRVDALLDPYGSVGAYGRDDQVSDAFLSSEMDQLRNFGAVMPPIFLAVAAFLLNIVIGRMVDTEREQIGLLKAFGYSNMAVGGHYLKFVGLLTALGVLLGFAGGAWMGRGLAELYTDYFRFPFLYYRADAAVFAGGVLISVAAAAAGTIAAVRRAVRLEPAVAMRPAPPTRYGRALVERIVPRRLTDQPTRMILRHIGRWPVRSGLTVTGISMAVALLIAANFSLDSMDHMIDVNFFRAERQTMTVQFEEPRHADALRAVANLPGVMAAEPFRAVAVRLRHGPREKRTAITGMVQEANISRVVDTDIQPVEPPAEGGVLLSSYLADLLDVERGGTVTVDVMEGRRPTVELPVADIVESYIGIGAYMEFSALNRLMREGRTVSGVYVINDTGVEEALYRELKETPAVSGVSLQRESVRTFRDTVEESFSTMVFFNALFAGVIAVGVVYNAARISLSERARELASLRVLGFTRGEVAYILLGELALLTFAALLPGCLMGYGLAQLIGYGLQTELYRIPVIINPPTYGQAVLIVVAASVASGLVVGRRVARLDLVSVLKTRE